MRVTDKTLALVTFVAAMSAFDAHAHISMKGALQSRGGDQKHFPCDGNRGDGPVYTFAPGTTITLAVNEDVPHPSYFRIAFDDDGEDFVEPASIDPIDKTRACPFDKDDQCGKSDYCTMAGAAKGAVVLWDNLDPHLAVDAKGGSWNIKLPDTECDNCTLQVLQIMEDTVHGAYCPDGSCAASGNSLEDIYHRCVDIKLVKDAPSGPGVTTDAIDNNGVDCSANASGAAGAGGVTAGQPSAGAPAAGAAGVSATGGAGSGGAVSSGAAGGGATSTAGATSSGSAAGATSSTPPSGNGGSFAAGSAAGASGTKSSSGTAGAVGGATTSITNGNSAQGTPTTPAATTKSSGGGCGVVHGETNDVSWIWFVTALGYAAGRRRSHRSRYA